MDFVNFANFELITDANGLFEKFIFRRSVDSKLHDSLLDITNDEQFYNDEVTMTPLQLFQYVAQINGRVESGNESLMPLALILSDCFKEKNNQYEKMSKDGKITFDHLVRLFPIGIQFVAYAEEGQLVGSVVHNATVRSGMMGEKYLIVTGMFTFSDGKNFIQKRKEFAISEFSGLKHIDTLPVRPMTPTEHEYLTNRGRIFLKHGLGVHYLAYNATMFYESMYGNVHFNAHGRIMVDKIGYNVVNPNDIDNMNHRFQHEGEKHQTFTEIPDDALYLAWPFFKGFSFTAKRWGNIFVEKLEEIHFDDNAFNYLVLDENKKRIAKSLVVHSGKSFTDIISGKSGGCIFLLHGPPGTGKTLTCEAIAELLHRPLYSITVGELGTTPETLEKKLTQILEMTKSWNAVILIDEADIFLEKRTENDIQRNAMVGIFLRLLERHLGVMFLTTNRANSIDEAFRSRISVVFHYNTLDISMRRQIWINLLSASQCSLSLDDVNSLSTYEINGRQIKNAIRMAQSLAMSDNLIMNINHLHEVIKLM